MPNAIQRQLSSSLNKLQRLWESDIIWKKFGDIVLFFRRLLPRKGWGHNWLRLWDVLLFVCCTGNLSSVLSRWVVLQRENESMRFCGKCVRMPSVVFYKNFKRLINSRSFQKKKNFFLFSKKGQRRFWFTLTCMQISWRISESEQIEFDVVEKRLWAQRKNDNVVAPPVISVVYHALQDLFTIFWLFSGLYRSKKFCRPGQLCKHTKVWTASVDLSRA